MTRASLVVARVRQAAADLFVLGLDFRLALHLARRIHDPPPLRSSFLVVVYLVQFPKYRSSDARPTEFTATLYQEQSSDLYGTVPAPGYRSVTTFTCKTF